MCELMIQISEWVIQKLKVVFIVPKHRYRS